MADRLIFVLVIIVIPLTILMTLYRLLSEELALSIVWTAFLVSLAIGLLRFSRAT